MHGSCNCTSNRRWKPVRDWQKVWQCDTAESFLFPLAVRSKLLVTPMPHVDRGEVTSGHTFMPPVGGNAHHGQQQNKNNHPATTNEKKGEKTSSSINDQNKPHPNPKYLPWSFTEVTSTDCRVWWGTVVFYIFKRLLTLLLSFSCWGHSGIFHYLPVLTHIVVQEQLP